MALDILLNKNPRLCPVRYCRHPRSPERHRKNGICSRCWMREWRKNNPVKAAYAHLRWSAKYRRKEFALTFEEFSAWCAQNKYIELRGREGSCAQIDRIDHRGGYSLANIQLLSCSENSAKGAREKYLQYKEGPF